MVFQRISEDIKLRALYLLSIGYLTEDVCDILGVSDSSLQRWKANQEQHGSVIPPPGVTRGRPRTLNADMTHSLITLLKDAPDMYLDEIQDWIAATQDSGLSRSGIAKILADCGMTYKLLHKAAAERNDEARAEWKAKVNAHYVAEQIVVVDESSKDERTLYRRYGRAPVGQRADLAAPFVRGERYSLVAAMGLEGYLATRVVEGSVDGDEFMDFIINEVLPKMNRFPLPNSVLIMDNCAIHKSSILRELIEDQGIVLVFLPPYSPDLNPIEESFSCVKAWIRRHWDRMQAMDPFIGILEATTAVTAVKAKEWYRHSGYKIN
ncbi:Transposase IS630-like protein [Pleurotus pulmonarius]